MVNWRRQFGRLGVGAALLSCASLVGAQAGDAGQWLQRIQQAAADRTYQGTMMTSAAGVVSSSRVAHICNGRERYERIEVLDGQVRRQYRHNGLVLTLWPQTKVAVVEQQDSIADFPSLPSASVRALDSYELRSIGMDRIAGHEAEVLMLKPRDGHRYAQRLWAERESGLLLRTDVLGPRGEVLESSAFTDLSIGGKLATDTVLGPMKKLDGYRVVRPQNQRTQLEAEGWMLARSVPGFQLLSCVKRPLDAVAEGSAAEQVMQTVFSDGLTHVSVFIERFDAQRHKPMRTVLGATNTSMNRVGDWWITVVGDVPMATVQQFESMLQRRP
ncbi:MucB/RseB C-terminal domain-containing protein [Aquabacterium sp.]|uniref:MucB/RseB C-terminal domain-containing protein n=1 Tax=Aquabacterium sp. TaxID=1872578 RepID=UPI002BA5E1DC|nr:MucB/RseB C-terminal domain-containing protein [Aquabacterium sp.]HSW04873.1 MucB/RseB C-terminal domain-containing protein [Aquabacterium sp.]